MLIILSGPPAAGKSSVGECLSERFPRSACVSVDVIRQFIKSGHLDPWEPGAEAQLELATLVTQDIAKRYLDAGFVVVVDDVIIDDSEIKEYRELFDEVYAFLLLPSLDVLRKRDNLREPDQRMGDRVVELYREFVKAEHQEFILVDSSTQTLEETVAAIISFLGTRNASKDS